MTINVESKIISRLLITRPENKLILHDGKKWEQTD